MAKNSTLIHHPHYGRWSAMRGRCLNPKNTSFKDYGARGIKIYPLWIVDFDAFVTYIDSLPDADKAVEYTLDRIDNDGNYEPGNLRWADRITQRNNQRSAKTGYQRRYEHHPTWKPRDSKLNLDF